MLVTIIMPVTATSLVSGSPARDSSVLLALFWHLGVRTMHPLA